MELLQPQALLKKGLILSESFDIDDAFGHGVLQKQAMVLGIMGVFLMSTHFAVIKVIAGDVDHWCQQPPDSNVSAIIWRKEFIPVEADGRPSRCRAYYKNQTDFNNTEPTACNEWEYDVSTAGSTIVSVWNLVCHRRVLLVAALAAHNSGRMLSIVAGLIADYLGRAPVIRVVAGLMVISTVASCFRDIIRHLHNHPIRNDWFCECKLPDDCRDFI
ncbi:hypothetical protein HPB48_022395 [Haemaphysalis longicornis]|uniref:Uncharacterized protein n=1 Tax=Haemaphysalis longicornis TaxID=44386 RepID=A0A9J6FXJ3_HAELO|nr:hypothetical protein HPB48_022395 [Haemaphysalis longicornis]